MATCPTCKIALQTVRQRDGLYYYCGQCNGRAVTVPQIRRLTGDRFASGLVRKINTATQVSWLECPFCQCSMKSFDVSDPPVTLNSCRPCVVVWFEAGKFEVLPEGVLDSPDSVLLTAAEAEAKHKMQQQAALGEDVLTDPPDEAWKWIPASLGFPVKYYNAEVASRPWVTWGLSLLIVIVSFCAFSDLREAIENFGLVPAHALRYGGLTFLTSFFLHAGFAHLFGNLYFFLLFGGEVEGILGWWRFLLLIFGSDFVGNILDIVGDPRSNLPTIGASAGISGVLVFYAFQFPRARIAIFFWWLWLRGHSGWVRLPAWVLFGLWFVMQLFGAMIQMSGHGTVASLAHLGGVAAGLGLWFLWRKRPAAAPAAEGAN
ncbi:MAG TPA: rhomboid family intramembrane serine protease [Candidatus Sulfotelmatobacter sp.]|nr:rhomboid family intramembrane serine protease [Candidatus Sulfotelmatobacter sp.]